MKIAVIDTETTGLYFYEGHKIIEIACIEIINEKIIEKNIFHEYINPERKISDEAKKITGLNEEFLKNKPKFNDIVNNLFNYLKDKKCLMMHNANFDINFINNELKLIDYEIKNIKTKFDIIDTLELARKIHPGKKNNLDALCKRYNIDLSDRYYHSALTDAKLLAKLYIKMNAIKDKEEKQTQNLHDNTKIKITKITKNEEAEHENYIKNIKKKMYGQY